MRYIDLKSPAEAHSSYTFDPLEQKLNGYEGNPQIRHRNQDFEFVARLIKERKISEVYEELIGPAYDSEDFNYYNFLKQLISIHQLDPEYYYYALQMMVQVFCHYPHGYEIAFQHAKNAVELSPEDHSFKEYILRFYEIPDRLLDKDMAVSYARIVLRNDPNSAAAADLLRRAEESE